MFDFSLFNQIRPADMPHVRTASGSRKNSFPQAVLAADFKTFSSLNVVMNVQTKHM